ncbi:hypothetical protein HB162lentus_05700 [Mammaliicoccus lentus]
MIERLYNSVSISIDSLCFGVKKYYYNMFYEKVTHFKKIVIINKHNQSKNNNIILS